MRALAACQGGYVSIAQLKQFGFHSALVRYHVRQARLQRVQRGVYRVAHLPPSDDEDLVVLWLWSGQRAVCSHRTALALHGLSDALPAGIDLTLPAADARRRLRVPTGVQLHFGDLADAERRWVGNVPVTSVLRTLQDCAALPVTPDLLGQAIDEALQRGLVKEADPGPWHGGGGW
jgi:predicted transcriptional regulator of viral defense system